MNVSLSTDTDCIGTQPSEFDVLCGQGRRNQAHPGNVRYAYLLSILEPKYLASNSNSEKNRMAWRIIKEIRSRGDFLVYDKQAKRWHPVKDDEVLVKVSQALRYRKRQFKKARTHTKSSHGEDIFKSLGSHRMDCGRMIPAEPGIFSAEIEPTPLQDMIIQPYVSPCEVPRGVSSTCVSPLTQRVFDIFDHSTPFTRQELSDVLTSALNEPEPRYDDASELELQ